jgi:exopolyphosphatase/guanosine-5'-triphosphate,3'-diphosphate pyrophosphatase
MRRLGWSSVVGASGTIKAVDKVVHSMLGHPHITPAGLDAVVKAALACRHVDKLRLPGLNEVRQPVFMGGLAILRAVVESLGIQSMTAAQGALREGVLLDLLGRLHHTDIRDDAVARLAVRYGVDRAHAARVRTTALRFFDQARGSWGLTTYRHRRLLAWAADLHEAGIFINHRAHHHHGAYLLRHADLPGFSRQDQAALAGLVRVHRGRLSLAKVEAFYPGRALPILRLGVLLRLATGLHRSRPAGVDAVRLSVDGKRIELGLPEGYLDARPLSAADLEREAKILETAGFQLTSHVLTE